MADENRPFRSQSVREPKSRSKNKPLDRQKILHRLQTSQNVESEEEPSPTKKDRARTFRENIVQVNYYERFLNEDPALVYCIRQLRLTTDLVFDEIKGCADFSESYSTIKDLAENMVTLHGRALAALPTFGTAFAYELKRFLVMVERMVLLYDPDQTETHYKWRDVGDILIQRAEARQRETLPDTAYIPRLQDFQLIQELGAGGFGAVYNAIYKPTNHTFALKVVRRGRILSHMEKMIAAFTDHPLVIKYHAVFLAKDDIITIMEHVNGIDLLKYINGRGNMPYNDIRIVSYQLVLAVEHLHLRGFMHQDIKPQNILITKTGHIKLIDFDIGKLSLGHHVKNRTLPIYLDITANEHCDRVRNGTAVFMPPERFVLTERYGRALDWWAVGVTMFNIITGTYPFRAYKNFTLAHVVCKSPLFWPSHVEVDPRNPMFDIVKRLLTKDGNQRLGTPSPATIKNHPFFRDCPQQPWTLPVVIDSESHRAAFDRMLQTMPPVRDDLQMRAQDLPPTEHRPEFTHISKRFRRLFRHANEKDHPAECDCLTFFSSEDEPSDPINYDNDQPVADALVLPEIGPVPINTEPFERETICLTMRTNMNEALGCEVFQVNDDNGEPTLMISKVDEGSPAERAGLCWGDIVVSINGREKPTETDFINAIRNQSSCSITTNKYSIYRLLLNPEFTTLNFLYDIEMHCVHTLINDVDAIRYRKVSCFNMQRNEMVDIMVVASTVDDVISGGSVYPGDIIESIEDWDNAGVPCISFRIIPTSVLRFNLTTEELGIVVLYLYEAKAL